jgi:transposase
MAKRKTYDQAFKLDAARLVVEHGYSCREAAKRLGACEWSVRQWLKKFKKTGELGGTEVSAGEEMAALRKENRQLQMENEILKKAAAYFAKESL